MQEFLEAIIALPTVLFTVPLGLAVIYWLFVVVGAADMDLLGGVDAAAEGVVEGAVEGAAEAAAEGGADGIAFVLSLLRFRSAPVTVVASFFFFFGWVLSFFGQAWAGALLGELLPAWGVGTLVFLVAFAGSTLLTSAALRPLAPIFETTTARGGLHLVGKTCVVRTGRVDRRFGQAEMHDGGAGLLLHVRCGDELALKKGDEALVIEYDAHHDVYWIEPMKGLLSSSGEGVARVPVERERAQS